MAPTASAPAVRILVVDDSLPCREAIHALIDATAGFEWIGEATCGEKGVEEAARLGPDLVLMDIQMPGFGGVEAAKMIASRPLPATVILITGGALPTSVRDGAAVEIVPKERLSPGSLARLWEQHGGAEPLG
jgi:DNA-binding NarL/FixJ family response regulator